MFTYKDVAGKEDDNIFIPGYEFSWILPIDLANDYKNRNFQEIDTVNAALRLGYYMGVEAQKAQMIQETASLNGDKRSLRV